MTMNVNGEDFKDIEAIFLKRKCKRYEELIANSRKESVAQPRVEVKRQGKVRVKDIKKNNNKYISMLCFNSRRLCWV